MTTEPKARPRPKPRNAKTEAWLEYEPPKPSTKPAPAKEWPFEQARTEALAHALRWIEYIPERAAWRWTPKGPEISPRRFAIFVCEFLQAYDCPFNIYTVDECEQRLISMWLAGRR